MIKLFSSNIFGFLRNPKLAQQSFVKSLISRGVTCDADNLVDYQSDSTSTHTNCLIQLLKSGWLRSFVSTEARILQQPLSLSSVYFTKFSEFLFQLQTLDRFDHSLAGGEFYSVSNRCQPPFSPLSIQKIKTLLRSETWLTHCFARSFPFRLRRKWGEL